ncbi:MAG TPA: hypothetical protein VHD56_18665 [Tepidisphaeraceae bacterium]|nr:hypothetical protein [Tepidisphaeraceae bacterium]
MDDSWWLEHIFAKSLADKTNPADAKLVASLRPHEVIGLITRLFSNCGKLLLPYSDEQIGEGLVFIAAGGESDWMRYIYDPTIDRQSRFECIDSIEIVYRDCFARRCINEVFVNSRPLSTVCYMWWDRFPNGGANSTESESATIDVKLVELMGRALQIEHLACQHSLLHGLGHWHTSDKDLTSNIISDWLEKHPHVPPSLRKYAEGARSGNVM